MFVDGGSGSFAPASTINEHLQQDEIQGYLPELLEP
jgi:hypothetical protein